MVVDQEAVGPSGQAVGLPQRESDRYPEVFAAFPPQRESSEPSGPVTAPVARLCHEVTVLADAPLRDRYGFPTAGRGPAGQADVMALARARHRMEATLAQRMLAAEQAGSLGFAPATVLQQQQWSAAEARQLRAAAAFAEQVAPWCPRVWQLWLTGAVSTAQVAAVADDNIGRPAIQVAPILAAILPRITELSPMLLRRAVAEARRIVDPHTADQAEQAEWDDRYVTIKRRDGRYRISGQLPAVEAKALATVLDGLAEQARAEGDGLTRGQRYADALAQLVSIGADAAAPSKGGLPAATTITVPVAEAERVANGQARDPHELDPHAQPGATLDHHDPLGDAAVRFGLCCTDLTPIAVAEPGSLLDRITGTGILPLAVGRDQRLATTAQRKAVRLRDQGCVIEGCDIAADRCQVHHVHDWSLGGRTDLHDLASLCWAHHRQVDLHRWELTWDRHRRRWRTQPTPRYTWRTPQPRR